MRAEEKDSVGGAHQEDVTAGPGPLAAPHPSFALGMYILPTAPIPAALSRNKPQEAMSCWTIMWPEHGLNSVKLSTYTFGTLAGGRADLFVSLLRTSLCVSSLVGETCGLPGGMVPLFPQSLLANHV